MRGDNTNAGDAVRIGEIRINAPFQGDMAFLDSLHVKANRWDRAGLALVLSPSSNLILDLGYG